MNKYKVQVITSDGCKYPLNVEQGQSIIDAALESGLNLPYSCYQPWLVINNIDVMESKSSNSETLQVKTAKTKDAFCESQELLDRLLSEDKKGRPIHNTRLSRSRSMVS